MLDEVPRSEFDIVPWHSSFETGIAIIDEQHRRLVELINDLAHQYVNGISQKQTEQIINALVDYAAYHFTTEEALWAEALTESNDNWLRGHLKTHHGFVDKIRAMQSKINTDDNLAVLDELIAFLTSWLAHHILYEDRRLALMLQQVRKGVDLNTAKQHAIDAMRLQTSALIQSVLSMYKELSSRTLALERESHSRQRAQQALLDQEKRWNSILSADSDSLWDWSFSTDDTSTDDQLLATDQFTQSGFTVHNDDWPGLQQSFIAHMLGKSDVFCHQHRLIDAQGNQRWVQSRGKIIEQDAAGRPKRMVGTQTDITERKTAELALQRERDTRTLISEFAADFMASSTEDFNAAINRALQRSGEYIQADRTYIFLVSDDGVYMDNTHEWCAAGIAPKIENLQSIAIDTLSWWWSQLRDAGYVLIPNITDIPPEAQAECAILQSQQTRSMCVYPLHIGKQLVGFMGNNSSSEVCHWGPEIIEFLSLMSDLLGIALGHRQLHQKRALVISQLERAEQQAQLGHWRIDYASSTVMWSQELFRILERDADHFIPDLNTYIELAHPDDRAALQRSYKKAKASLSPLNIEHRVLLHQTKIKHLEIRGQFTATPDGHFVIAQGTVQDVTEKVQHRESLQRLAFQDTLTGLPNRRSLEDSLLREMDYCKQYDRRLMLALLDLDNFSETNDRYGAALGDRLLKALAQRMRRVFNDAAVIARIGGDEFVVLFTQLQPEESYFQQLNQLLSIISTPLTLDDIDIVLTASIGITEFPQPIEVMGEQLLRQAQQALFQAKIQGKGRVQTYDIGSEHDTRVLTGQIEQIRQALLASELVLYYQPKVYMKTGVMFGVEALVRWKKSTGELVHPGEFLPALHNHPLEVELGDWVIRTALAQLCTWKQQGLDIQVSVNVSSQQLLDPGFVDKLSKDLHDYPDISPSALQLEVLESSALNDLEAVSRVMQQSQQLGVSFALDDFGTGYSSLAHLKHLPVSVLKIDQSFVGEMLESSDDLSIISAVMGMAKAFGLQVIAEGVENTEQGSLLLRLGCDQAQGYGIARPMPAEQMHDWVMHWKVEPNWQEQSAVDTHNLPLLYAEVEHRRWVIELEQWLRSERSAVPMLDHHRCGVGLWIEDEGQSRFGLPSKFDHLVSLHHQLHSLGQSATALHTNNNSEAALAMLPEIKHLRDLLLTELQLLIE